MSQSNPNAPEFIEGYKSGFHDGMEQARESSQRAGGEGKKEEKKEPPKPNPIRQKLGAFFQNRIFQVVAAAALLIVICYFLYEASIHVSTDDAYTDGHVHNISSRVTGTVINVNVDDNERVKQGQVLVVLDPTDFETQVAQAEANYAKAQADDARGQKLQGNGAISQQDYDQLNAALKVAAAQLKQARDQLTYTVIVSPADGRIGHKSVETGQQITAGSAIMAVIENTWVVANFEETQLGRMRIGQSATIHIDAIPGITFRGYVDSWSPGSGSTFALLPSDNATGNFTKIVQRVPVKIRFDPQSIQGYEQRLVPGLSCEPDVLIEGGEANRTSPVHPQLESIPIKDSR